MKKIGAWMLILMLLCAGCAPSEDANTTFPAGSEDGGGSGYGVSVKSVLRLSDFYGLTVGSTRDHNLLMLGSPLYSLGGSDTYALEDGSQVVLTYSTAGTLSDTLYTDFNSGKSYGLFDYLISIGVLQGTIGGSSGNGNSSSTTPTTPSQGGQGNVAGVTVFSTAQYRKADFESKLSLYLERATVLSAIGAPNSFTARRFGADSYIIDCYRLEDGGTMMLDYGYDRKSLRAAAIKGADGITSSILGGWKEQSKPADFVRPTIGLGLVTALTKGSKPADIYQKLGEPAWFEGNATEYKDVYILGDDSKVYLSYENAHSKLSGAYQVTAEGKLIEVSLR